MKRRTENWGLQCATVKLKARVRECGNGYRIDKVAYLLVAIPVTFGTTNSKKNSTYILRTYNHEHIPHIGIVIYWV